MAIDGVLVMVDDVDAHFQQTKQAGATILSEPEEKSNRKKRRMLEIAQFLASLSCALFAGAAVYINLVEHPARMGCDTKTAVTVWAPSYKRATPVQAPLAVVSFLAGSVAWLLGGGLMWLVGATLIGLVVPFTLIAISPVNHQLLTPDRDPESAETRALREKWGRLHAVRSALSLAASVVYVVLLLRA